MMGVRAVIQATIKRLTLASMSNWDSQERFSLKPCWSS